MEIEIHVRLTDEQARDLAQFLKRVYYSDYRQHATGEAQAYRMLEARERIRCALAEIGYAPADLPQPHLVPADT